MTISLSSCPLCVPLPVRVKTKINTITYSIEHKCSKVESVRIPKLFPDWKGPSISCPTKWKINSLFPDFPLLSLDVRERGGGWREWEGEENKVLVQKEEEC